MSTRNQSDLRPYQLKAIDYILNKKRCGLALDMGLGKTIGSLTAFAKIHNIYVKHILVIAPLKVANDTWNNEILQWEHTKHLTYSIATGNEKERLEALNKDVDVYITSHNNIPWMYKKGFKKYGMIIVDESHGFKNHNSKRFKFLSKFISRCIVLLTGTPMPNGEMDLWSQQYLIDKGKMLGKNITEYRDTYFNYTMVKNKDGKTSRPVYVCHSPKIIHEKLKANWLSMKAEDYLDLPDKLYNIINVEIDNLQLYKKFEKEYLLKINCETIEAVNGAVLTNKLLQYCNGAVYNENKEYVEIHSNKLDAIQDIIDNYPDENILVAFNFKCDEDRIRVRFKGVITLTAKNGSEIMDKWNKGKIKLLLCQCSTAEGLNLQHGGRIIVWFGLTWSMKNYKQFNARLHRQGQTKPVIIYHLVAKGCKDEKVAKVLAMKDCNQEELIKVLKSNDI